MIINPYLTINKVKWLSICFFATIIPHFIHSPLWVTFAIILAVVWRFHLSNTGSAIPSLLIRICLVAMAVALIYIQYGILLGRDPGVSFLLLMLAFKMLEIKTKRDVLFFLFLNYFVIVTNFLYLQNILIALYMFIAVWVNTAVLININRLTVTANIKHDFRLAFTLIAQAVPIMLVMFLLFPRIEASLWSALEDNSSRLTGLSEQMNPGDISSLIKNHKIAFRVHFKNNAPVKRDMYWRGPVLSVFQGKRWSSLQAVPINLLTHRLKGTSYHYTITLEASGRKYLPTLDKAGNAPNNAFLSQEYSAYANVKIDNRRSYSLFSRAFDAKPQAELVNRQLYTQTQAKLNPKTQHYIQTLKKHIKTPEAIVNHVLLMFQNQKYIYSLKPPLLGEHAIDEFLFKTRKGFCEHYASAFVILMRYAGIPARVVTGYQGGEYNPVGNYYIIRNSDAHAWAEIWLPNKAWLRIDPTAYIAPERIEKGIDASLAGDTSWTRSQYSNNKIIRKMSYYWDSINNSWNQWILGYGEDLQTKFLALLGFDNPNWQQMITLLIISISLTFFFFFLYYHYRKFRTKKSPTERLYHLFCKKLASIGMEKYSWEGPNCYYKRINESQNKVTKQLSAESKPIIELYIQLKYDTNTETRLLTELKVLVKNFQPNRFISK